jgi:hypothetical protein
MKTKAKRKGRKEGDEEDISNLHARELFRDRQKEPKKERILRGIGSTVRA